MSGNFKRFAIAAVLWAKPAGVGTQLAVQSAWDFGTAPLHDGAQLNFERAVGHAPHEANIAPGVQRGYVPAGGGWTRLPVPALDADGKLPAPGAPGAPQWPHVVNPAGAVVHEVYGRTFRQGASPQLVPVVGTAIVTIELYSFLREMHAIRAQP